MESLEPMAGKSNRKEGSSCPDQEYKGDCAIPASDVAEADLKHKEERPVSAVKTDQPENPPTTVYQPEESIPSSDLIPISGEDKPSSGAEVESSDVKEEEATEPESQLLSTSPALNSMHSAAEGTPSSVEFPPDKDVKDSPISPTEEYKPESESDLISHLDIETPEQDLIEDLVVSDSLSHGDELKELILEPETEDSSLKPGMVHILGNQHYVVESCLPRGYYKGRIEGNVTAPSILFRTHSVPHSALWLEGKTGEIHPRLPRILYEGEDGLALELLEGEQVPLGLPLHDAVAYLHGVVQLMRFLSIKGLVTVDIDLSGLVLSENQGVRLQYLPTVALKGEPAQIYLGDGVTPIEGSTTQSAAESTCVFLWGAMLYMLVTGSSMPAEGLGTSTLSQLKEPGLPQLLFASMMQDEQCPDLRSLMRLYSIYRRTPIPQYQLGAASTVGLNPDRLFNEDSYGIVHNLWEFHDAHIQVIRACVADGMGGEEKGEVASKVAVDTFCNFKAPPQLEFPEIQSEWTRELGLAANAAVVETMEGSGGGCTLTGVVVLDDRLTMAHVGDSRAYLYSAKEGLQLLSRDHSMVRALLDSGNMTEDEAAESTEVNQVLRALGTANAQTLHEEWVDSLASKNDQENGPRHGSWLRLQVDDLVLLMSDGIWGSWEYREQVIAAELTKVIVEAYHNPQEIANALIRCALDAGADDNATIVVLKRTG